MPDTIKELSPKDAQLKIREILKRGCVTPSFHCREQMEKRNYDVNDLEHILEKGVIKKEPEYDIKHGHWKYRVEGKAIDGDEAIAVTAIISHDELIIITVMPSS